MSETFTAFVTGAPTRTLDGTELIPLVTSTPDTEKQTLANIADYINAPPSLNLTFPGPYTLTTSTDIYYVSMSADGTFSAYLPTSSSMTNRTLTFVTINNVDEGGLNLCPNGDDQIQNGGGSSSYFVPGNGNNSVSILSDGVGNWWITSQYSV